MTNRLIDQKPNEINTIMAEYEKLLIAEDEARWKNAPRCHMRPMFIDEADSGDYHTEIWWECSVCGHTKSLSKVPRS